MSTSASAFEQASARLLGGLAVHADIVPAIIFTVAYALLVPVAAWRMALAHSRNFVLIRPCIFTLIRVATWIVRAIEGNGNYSEGVIVAETIFLTAGTVLIVEPLVALTTGMLEHAVPNTGRVSYDRKGKPRRSDEVGLVGRVLRLALLASIALAIYSSTNSTALFNDPNGNTAHTLTTLREVIAIILLAASGIILGSMLYFAPAGLPSGPVKFITAAALLLCALSGYRVAAAFRAPHVNDRAAFYLALALPEFLVTVLYFAFNLNTLFPHLHRGAPGAGAGAVPMQNTNYGQQPYAPPPGPPAGYNA